MNRSLSLIMSSVPLIVGLLYFVGAIYDEAYFSVYGLGSDMFARNFNDTLMKGVLALSSAASRSSVITAALFFFVVPIVTILLGRVVKRRADMCGDYDTRGQEAEESPRRLRRELPEWVHFSGLVSGIFGFICFSGFVLAILVFSTASKVVMESDRAAHQKLKYIGADTWDARSIYDTRIETVGISIDDRKRRLLDCTPTACVFLTKEGLETISSQYIAVLMTTARDSR